MADEFDEEPRLDEHESALVRQDLKDLSRFEETFAAEGYRGVSVFCRDCEEEHFYPWAMLRENLEALLETGETPVHEPAFAPEPDQYVPWEYARGYVDALADVGVHERVEVDACPHCRWRIPQDLRESNFCPRCGAPLLRERLRRVLTGRGVQDVDAVLREAGLPG
ncbi:MAG: DUF5319 domain-containing protein [Actinomycetota bacterium]|nr:DUF5319 domain-containing protein [Actinomycetota bacterium]